MKCNVFGHFTCRKIEAHTEKGVCFFVLEIIRKMIKKNWKLYLYYNGILVKVVRIYENEAPIHNSYVVRVWFKKHLFGSNVATVILRPVELLKNDDEHQKTHWGAVYERGVEI